MRKIFEAELTALGDDLIGLSEAVQHAITQAGAALLGANLEVAQAVIAGDSEIDAMAQIAEERAVLLLAQQAPVATDLRVVVTALRMTSTFERMGDLAQHLALVARRSYPARALPPGAEPIFHDLQQAAERLAKRLPTLLSSRDLEIAHAIERDDDVIDALHQDTFRAMLATGWGGTTQQIVDVTLVGRYYERFGDHGVSIARRVIYLVTGEDGRV